MMSEQARAATGFCYLQAAGLALSGAVQLAAGPRLSGLTKLGAAGTLVWAGLAPSSDRLQVAAGVSAGSAAVDVVSAVLPGAGALRRIASVGSAGVNALFAVIHREASQDV